MRLIVKIILGLLILVILGMVGMISYVKFALPKTSDAPDLQIELTPERLERGEYLSLYVAGCIECHSKRDWNTFSGPVIAGTEGAGGDKYTQEMGIPGTMYPSNITPVGLGDWSDGEVFRAITSGVDKDGNALFPFMPYHNYGKMDKEDIYSMIAYIRTLEPKGEKTPERKLDFPLGIIVNLMQKDATFSALPDTNDWVAYGEYMGNAAGCIPCHTTQDDKGRPLPGMLFAGGNEYPMPSFGIVRSANLTPDNETGIGQWTEDAWIARMTMFADSSIMLPSVGPGALNSIMAWSLHGKMKETDLKAIYRYIQTIEPVSNKVEKFTPY